MMGGLKTERRFDEGAYRLDMVKAQYSPKSSIDDKK